MKKIEELLITLSNVHGTPGCEESAMEIAKKALSFCKNIQSDKICGVSAFLGDEAATRQIMLDAHIDQIGMIVTEIDDDGFLHITNVGGIDRRTMPGSRVKVYGQEEFTGIVCCLPPHISGGNEKISKVQEQIIDVGLSKNEIEEFISVGDRVILTSNVRPLIGTRISGSALDDRAGCAAIIRAAELLKDCKLNCGVHIALTTREEVGGQGAQIQAYRLSPTEAIAVDVSFAKQFDVDNSGLAELGKGTMIGFSASLDRGMGHELIALAKKYSIPYQLEAMGGQTGTNCDSIGTVKRGIPCALLSIPQRNMHTPSEVCDLVDIESTAKLIAAYVQEVQ